MAVLAGTETPADVAAIMSWFYEDPRRLADVAPEDIGGGSKDPDAPGETSPRSSSPTCRVRRWRRQRQRQPPGKRNQGKLVPVYGPDLRRLPRETRTLRRSRAQAARVMMTVTMMMLDGDDDRDDDQGVMMKKTLPSSGLSLHSSDCLICLLKQDAESRQAVIAFDLAQYICERLRTGRRPGNKRGWKNYARAC